MYVSGLCPLRGGGGLSSTLLCPLRKHKKNSNFKYITLNFQIYHTNIFLLSTQEYVVHIPYYSLVPNRRGGWNNRGVGKKYLTFTKSNITNTIISVKINSNF